MQTQYENQGGLLVIPGTNQCAGYILDFEGHGAYHPIGKVETPQGPTKDEIAAHNAILAKAELVHAIEAGKAVSESEVLATLYTTYEHITVLEIRERRPWRTSMS